MIDLAISFSWTPLSYLFSLLVLLISLATNTYILNYFRNEADEGGFIFWINSFVISMVILILAGNFFTLFLGWELIGLTSFFLINFWQGRRGTLKASFKAFSFNLFSDLCLLGALVIFYHLTMTTDISTCIYLLVWTDLCNTKLLQVGIFLLIICASIKSVQIIGHLWLPDSMEAPVPASALIHSATLVSAGIYILARFNLILLVQGWLPVLGWLGMLTAAYGGVVAAAQTDLKKLLAYSTMSHCGFLMVLVSFSNFYILITYLFLHGIYKAATFFCAGSFIRIYGSQDTRLMGAGQHLFMADATLLILCAANLCGLPLTIGILYKTFFLKALINYNLTILAVGFMFIGLLVGVVYFYRLLYYTLFDKAKWTNLSTYNYLEITALHLKSIMAVISRNHVIAAGVLLIAGVFVYILFVWVVESSIMEYEMGIYQNHLPPYLLSTVWNLYAIYFIYFYLVYLLIISSLIFITWYRQYVSLLKHNVYISSIGIILLGTICSNLVA